MTINTMQDTEAKPFAFIFAALCLVVLTIGVARLAGYQPPPSLPADPAIQMREIAIDDAAQGSVIVRDAKNGALIKTYHRGEGSFFRATLRTLVHDRQHKGLSQEGHFRLETHMGNQLFLIDEVSGKTLSMNAFGPDNTAVFAALLFNPQQGESQ